MERELTIVIGAGPYGLSVAAHLKARSIPTLIFGKPMEFWQNMHSGLYLKLVWSASSLSDSVDAYSLSHYLEATNIPRQEPIPLPLFLNYGHWYQQNLVPDVDPTYVQTLAHDGKRFHLDLTDGRKMKARQEFGRSQATHKGQS